MVLKDENMRSIGLLLFIFLSSVKTTAPNQNTRFATFIERLLCFFTKIFRNSRNQIQNAIIIDTIFKKETHLINRTRDIKFFKEKLTFTFSARLFY